MATSQIIIKVILGIAILTVAIFMMRTRGSDSSLALRRLTMLAFATFALVAVAWPTLVTYLARLIGVGRGTDLLLYLLIIAFFGQMATAYRRNVKLEHRLTRLTRQIALNDARSEAFSSGAENVISAVELSPKKDAASSNARGESTDVKTV